MRPPALRLVAAWVIAWPVGVLVARLSGSTLANDLALGAGLLLGLLGVYVLYVATEGGDQ